MTWLKAEALRQGWSQLEWPFPNDGGKFHDDARVRKVFKPALAKRRIRPRMHGRRSGPRAPDVLQRCSSQRVTITLRAD